MLEKSSLSWKTQIEVGNFPISASSFQLEWKFSPTSAIFCNFMHAWVWVSWVCPLKVGKKKWEFERFYLKFFKLMVQNVILEESFKNGAG